MKSYKIKCSICGTEQSSYGISNHMRIKHGVVYSVKYNRVNKCLSCGKETYNPMYCSSKCSAKVLTMKRVASNKIKNYKLFSELDAFGAVDMHVAKRMSLKYISHKTGKSIDLIIKFFRERNIKVRHYGGSGTASIYNKKILDFINGDKGQLLLSTYKKEGESLRSLVRSTGLDRRFIKNVLLVAGVPLKSSREARNEVTKVKKLFGPNHPAFGKAPPVGSGKCGWYFYEGIKYQGSWEFKTGLWLKEKGINFLCHKDVPQFEYCIEGKEHTYCPDFYIPSDDKFIEVKGYFSSQDKLKIDAVRKKYPSIKLEILDKNSLKDRGILDIDKRHGIDIESYRINNKTGKFYYDDVLERENKDSLVSEIVKGTSSWAKKAAELNIPIQVFSAFIKRFLPKKGSKEFYLFLYDRYIKNEAVEKRIKEGINLYSFAKELSKNNGIKVCRNYKAIQFMGHVLTCQ